MNKNRRKKLAKIVDKLDAMEALRLEILEDMETVYEEEQEALNNLPYGLQTGDQAERMRDYIYSLEVAMGTMDEIDIETTRIYISEIDKEWTN